MTAHVSSRSEAESEYRHEVLVIAPHADDAELFCGGLLLRMKSLGYRTAVIDLSEAELSTYGSTEDRRKETEEASSLLGLSYRTNLGLPNCWFHEYLGFETFGSDSQSPAARLTRAIREVRPELVIAPYWHDRHPDHVQAARLATRCLFLAGLARYQPDPLPPCTPLQILRYSFRFEFEPSFIMDISAFAQEKYRLIECYRSQVLPPPRVGARTLLSSPLSMRALAARDAYLGAYIGVEYGEGFLSQAAVRIDDPVKHCRECSTSSALYFRGEV